MNERLKCLWTPWIILVTVFAAGMGAFYVSKTPAVAGLSLSKNAEADVSVFRLLPGYLGLSLRFDQAKDRKRPELGSWRSPGKWHETGFLDFPEPGESVMIKVRIIDTNEEVVYEALPADGVKRQLVPFVDDGNPHRISWPPVHVRLPAGISHMHVSVLEVGERISGEQVTLTIEPPLSFKSSQRGYEFLWWFFWWPAYAFALLVYAVVLLWIGGRA